jgi:acetylornithine deacetylase/succinyl-diaminopimelate desuccinylase family protein
MLTVESISIDGDAIVALTQRLVRMPTINPPGDYAEIAAVMRAEIDRAGLETVVMEGQPGKPNVFGILRANRPDAKTLLLSGHMDVVGPGDASAWKQEPFEATIVDGAMWGRGTVDMKGALAAQLEAVRAVKAAHGALPVNVMFGCTVDDEIAGGMGQRYVLDRGLASVGWPRPDFHVLGEATSLNITSAFKGRVWVRVALRGKTAHGGAPQEGVNAIDKMTAYVARLRARAPHRHPVLGDDTLNLGTISGGTRVNAVADECEAQLDHRFSDATGDEAVARLRDALDAFQREDGTFAVTKFEVFEKRDAVAVENESANIALLRRAIGSVTGRDPALGGALSAGGAYHSMKAGIPGVWVGPGDVRMLHAPNEHMPLDELKRAGKIYAAIILAYAGIG